MDLRTKPLHFPALLLSILAHGILAWTIGTSGGAPYTKLIRPPTTGTITVHFKKTDELPIIETERQQSVEQMPTALPALSVEPVVGQPVVEEVSVEPPTVEFLPSLELPQQFNLLQQLDEPDQVLPIIGQATPYYFRLSELTLKPRVAQDIPPNMILMVPEAPPQPAILRLLINEHGSIDQVIVENSQLPHAAEQRIIDTFSKLLFTPAEIDNMPVKSQLRIEIMLENMSSLPSGS